MAFVIRTSCPLCGSADKTTLVSLPFDGPEVSAFLASYYGGRLDVEMPGASYTLDRCSRCGVLWQREILDDAGMEALYTRWIDPRHSHTRRSNPALSLQYARYCARLLRLFPDPSSTLLMDYGMGWGDWCHMAQSFGFRVHGVELSEERLEHARSLGIPCSEAHDMPSGPYDFIHLEQVLEHVPDPDRMMRTLTGLLKPRGFIHIGVPDGDRAERAARGKDLPQLLQKGPAQPLEHINILTPASLRLFLKRLGYKPAGQREGLLRASPLTQMVSDLALAAARHLPPFLFPATTRMLFRKNA